MDFLIRNRVFSEKLLLVTVLVFIIYLPFHHFLTAWLGSLTEAHALLKIWKDILLAIVCLIFFTFSIIKKDIRRIVWRDPLNIAILSYVTLHFLLFAVYNNYREESAYAGLIFNLRFFALFIFIRISIIIFPNIQNRLRTLTLKAILIGAFVVSLIAIFQVTFPSQEIYESFGYNGVDTIAPIANVDSDPNTPRAFSTLRGPNELGAFMILPICAIVVLIFYKRKKWYLYGVLAIFVAALVFSYSRSALIGALVALLVFFTIYIGNRISTRQKIFSAAGTALVACLLLWGSLSIPQLRLFVFHSSPGDPSLFEGSTQGHLSATSKGISDAINNPLGRGPGEAGPASFYQTDELPRIAENYYVQIAQEVGFPGLILFLIINIELLRRLLRYRDDVIAMALFSSLIGLSVTSLFLHTWADDPTAYLWWCLAAIALSYDVVRAKKTKQLSQSTATANPAKQKTSWTH